MIEKLANLFDDSIAKYSTIETNVDVSNKAEEIVKEEEIIEKEEIVNDNVKVIEESGPPPSANERTVFIGNIPTSVASDKEVLSRFKKILKAFGPIDSIRFRSLSFAKPTSNRKHRQRAFLSGELHPDRNSMNAYVVFKNEESAVKCLSLNATEFEGHHLRVDKCDGSGKDNLNIRNSVFVGNLSFKSNEESLWRLFEENCGPVERVRVVRDKATNVGKGFAYIHFRDRSSVSLALDLNDTLEHEGRKLRIQRCKANTTAASVPYQGSTSRLTGAKLRLMRKTDKSKKTTKSNNTKKTRK